MSVELHLVDVSELDTDQRSQWNSLRAGAAVLDSPFHSPDWYSAVARVRPQTRVAILRENSELRMALPLDVSDPNCARPPGGSLSDHQGLVVDPSFDGDIRSMLRRLRIGRFAFDHASHGQPALDQYVTRWSPSPILDLSTGFDGYLESRRLAGSKIEKWATRKRKILEGMSGPMRFEVNADRRHLHSLMRWKSGQYQRQGSRGDLFANAWVRDLMELVLDDAPGFGAQLSALWSGDSLVAVHLGPSSPSIWHWWLPTYDPEFGRGSPGVLMLLAMAEAAAAQGVGEIDLGKGDEDYKERFANSAHLVGSGLIESSRMRPFIRRLVKPVRRSLQRVGVPG